MWEEERVGWWQLGWEGARAEEAEGVPEPGAPDREKVPSGVESNIFNTGRRQ